MMKSDVVPLSDFKELAEKLLQILDGAIVHDDAIEIIDRHLKVADDGYYLVEGDDDDDR